MAEVCVYEPGAIHVWLGAQTWELDDCGDATLVDADGDAIVTLRAETFDRIERDGVRVVNDSVFTTSSPLRVITHDARPACPTCQQQGCAHNA